MKKRIFTAFLTTAFIFTSLTITVRTQEIKQSNDAANLVLMLPDSDAIAAIDMDKALNVVAPNLLGQDEEKIRNLKKLMKSLENSVGINPYEINQAAAGIKFTVNETESIFDNPDFTIILRTKNSNDPLLFNWARKMDAIEAFEAEKEGSERYFSEFKHFRMHKLSKYRTDKLEEEKKSSDEIGKKLKEVETRLGYLSAAAKANKSYADSLKLYQSLTESTNKIKDVLNINTDSKSLSDSTVKLQNRRTLVDINDPERAKKLDEILKEAKTLYPVYKAKVEETVKVETILSLSDYEIFERFNKKRFGFETESEDKTVNEMIKTKLDAINKTLSTLSVSKTKQSIELNSVRKDLQKIQDFLTIRLDSLKDTEKFEDISKTEEKPEKPKASLLKELTENAKITQVNGKKMITVDPDKISYWNPAANEPAEEKSDVGKTAEAIKITVKPAGESTKKDTPAVVVEQDDDAPPPPMRPKPVSVNSNISVITVKPDPEKPKEPKKKENFAVGYLDDKTMVIGYEKGITEILKRDSEYKNPKAAEMLKSFDNPLISFAVNSKPFESLAKGYGVISNINKDKKDEKKKETPFEKFVKDINIFGSVEYVDINPTTNDIVLSLGFSKNKVEEVFNPGEEEDEEKPPVEIGDYQIGTSLFYDLLNTLKSYKASMSFKFEKRKAAALLESAPQIIENSQIKCPRAEAERTTKTKIQTFRDIKTLLTSPEFYINLRKSFAAKSKP